MSRFSPVSFSTCLSRSEDFTEYSYTREKVISMQNMIEENSHSLLLQYIILCVWFSFWHWLWVIQTIPGAFAVIGNSPHSHA